MKLLILSDIHGRNDLLVQVMEREADADNILFLGDGLEEMNRWQQQHPGHRVYAVRGNCDEAYAPAEALAAFHGFLFFYTHGHHYGVKSSLEMLSEAAAARGAQVALFGHTHAPLHTTLNGIELFNPGSIQLAAWADGFGSSYGVITVTPEGELHCEHRRV